MSTTIFIADDHQLILDGLRSQLKDVENFSVVGEATDGHEAVKMVKSLQPEVVILDIALPLL